MAQPTTTPFTGLVRAPEPIGDMPPRHIPRPTSRRALHCVPSGVVVRAWLPEPCPAATGGSGFTIETGSESAIGINPSVDFGGNGDRRLSCEVPDDSRVGGHPIVDIRLSPNDMCS